MAPTDNGAEVCFYISGGRARVPMAFDPSGDFTLNRIFSELYSDRYYIEQVQDQEPDIQQAIRDCVTVNGAVPMVYDVDSGSILFVDGVPLSEIPRYSFAELPEPDVTGLFEGIVILQKGTLECRAIVYNGALYPMLTGYNAGVGDNETASVVETQVDAPLTNLGDMLALADRKLCYVGEDDIWSEWESILNKALKMQIIPKVIPNHIETAGEGEALPLITYSYQL